MISFHSYFSALTTKGEQIKFNGLLEVPFTYLMKVSLSRGYSIYEGCFFVRNADYIAPNCLRYLSEFAFVASFGFKVRDFLKFRIAFSLSPFITYASPRLSQVLALAGYLSVLILNIWMASVCKPWLRS